MIGDIVKVTVDRPLGSCHPHYTNLRYLVNYGFIANIIAPDGEEQDAYVLGVNTPLSEFTGRVVAIIHRLDDVEDKWVVAPEGITLTKEEILDGVQFQERYFRFKLIL